MDFTKFVSMLENQGLYFSRADKLGDPFEGTYPKANIDWLKKVSDKSLNHDDLTESQKEFATLLNQIKNPSSVMQDVRRAAIMQTMISCWHMNEHESAAMWKAYTTTNEAIAICSTFEKLYESLDETCNVGKVNYIDFDCDSFSNYDFVNPFIHKRLSFKHEDEVRAVIADIKKIHIDAEVCEEENRTKRRNKDSWLSNYDTDVGIWKHVNLEYLLDEVRIAPMAPTWFSQLVEQVIKRYGLKTPIKQSRLDDAPFS